MLLTDVLENTRPELIPRVREALARRNLSPRLAQTYCHWIARFFQFSAQNAASLPSDSDRHAFMAYLERRLNLSRARLNQARQALQFFFQDVVAEDSNGPQFSAA